MREFDVFCRHLATSLLACADRRRASSASNPPKAEDLKIIALLERLAADVDNLDLHVFLIFELMFTEKRLAQKFLGQHDDLLAQLGVSYSPASATDLVRWLTKRTIENERAKRSSGAGRRWAAGVLPAARGRLTLRGAPASGRVAGRDRPTVSVASDISAAFGIVAPVLAVWEVGLGIDQWRDRAASQGHAAVPATVISSEPSAGVRNPGLSAKVMLSFRPSASSELCRLPVRISHAPAQPVSGATVMVTPLSAGCETPLIVSEIGDPLTTFAFAASLMIAGFGALKLWSRLNRPAVRRLRRPEPETSSRSRDAGVRSLAVR